MPVVFKIVIFLFLQQSGGVLSDKGENPGASFQVAEQAKRATLNLIGEIPVLQGIINASIKEDPSCEVKYTEAETLITFSKVDTEKRNRIMKRVQAMQICPGNFKFHWIEY